MNFFLVRALLSQQRGICRVRSIDSRDSKGALAILWPSAAKPPERRCRLLSAAIALLCIAVATLCAFTDVVKRLSDFDIAANGFFAAHRHPPWIEIFLWITTLGAGPTILLVVLVTSALLATGERRALVRPLWLAYLGTEATVWSTKYAVGRLRPEFISAASATSPSFPSGHSASSIAIYGILACVIALRLTNARHRAGLLMFTAAMVLAIGFSRIFLSLHFVTDVVAGYFIGGFWLLAGAVYCKSKRSG